MLISYITPDPILILNDYKIGIKTASFRHLIDTDGVQKKQICNGNYFVEITMHLTESLETLSF